MKRFGGHRKDDPATPLPIHVIVDGKQSLIFNSTFGFAKDPPFIRHTPINELYAPLMEFGVDVVLWKGVFEFPWHIGPIPIPGRKIFGFLPMPFVPYPWLSAVPGFGWVATGWSLFLQFASSTDPRNWWAMVTHVKHFSNEQAVLESGLDVGSKYNNEYSNFKTWHDMGVLAEGPIANDANDYYVRIFNEARRNNTGTAGTKGVQIHVILPGASDKPVLDTVAASEFNEMLRLGIKIYRWDPPSGWASSKMLHTKAWLVDFEPGRSGLTYVGSANATQRSHILDEEAGIASTSPDFAQEVFARLFQHDMTADSRIENAENFRVTFSTNWAIRSGRWIRRFLNGLFFI